MPSHRDYSERREAYVAWLTANRIDPGDVLLDADVYLDTTPDGARVIAYEACARDAQGRKHVNERGDGIALERRTTPLLADPPDWWEPYRKPTRDQLLGVLERVRALGPDLELEATLPGMHDAAREAKRDASRRIRSIIDQVVNP